MSEKSGNRKRGVYKKYLYSNLDEAIHPRTLKRRRDAKYFTPEQSRPSENLIVDLQPQQNDDHPEQNEEIYEDNTNHGSERDENDLQQAGPSTSNHTNFGQHVYNRPTQEEFQDFELDDSVSDDGGISYNDSSDGEQDGEAEENNGDNLIDAEILNEVEENSEGDVQFDQANEIFSSGESDNEDHVKEITSDDDELNDDNVEMVNSNFGDLLKYLFQNGSFSDWNTKISLAEILLLFLTICITHNISLAGMVDIMKVLNVIMNTTLFPATTFVFKKYFNPESDLKFHVVCENCGHYLGEKKSNKSFTCKICKFVNTMKGYRYENSFAILDIKSQLSTIISNNYSDLIFRSDSNLFYTDIHDGFMYRSLIPKSTATNLHLSITFNTDGTTAKDSKSSIWPIYLMINELDIKKRKENLVLAGIWYGQEKPRMDVFLKPFVSILNDLSKQGFSLNINDTIVETKFSTICCCVDSMARAPMQGLTSIRGYGGCSWCRQRGENVGGTVKYPIAGQGNERKRTDQNFKRDSISAFRSGQKVNGVMYLSPLLNLHKFSIVWGFFPDYMHCVLLGIVKRFLESWFAGTGNAYYIGGKQNISHLDGVMTNIRPPSILKRIPLKLSLRKYMKAREFENWLLFYSFPVLIGTLPTVFLNHWKLLVRAINILLQNKFTEQDINVANDLLRNFMIKTESLYGKYEMTHNMHQLQHLAESARRWGPIWARCGFPFESENEKLKRIIKATRGVPHQIVRSFELSQARKIICDGSVCHRRVIKTCEDIQKYKIRSFFKDDKQTLLDCGGDFTNTEGITGLPIEYQDITEYARIVRNGVVYSKNTMGLNENKTDNSYVELQNNSFGQIRHALLVNNNNNEKSLYVVIEQIFVKQVTGLEHIFKIVGRGDKSAYLFSMVKCVAVHVTASTNEFVCKIPEKHFIFNL